MEALRPGDPERIGGYALLARLGEGGMGEVFLGRSPGGLPVALKVVHAGLAGDESFRARFRREVGAARAVSGAFTAPVVDADPDAPLPWLATVFLPGMPLQDAVAAHGPLPTSAVFALGAGLAEALTSVHRAGVVHRDLKPSNVMLSPDGPRVIDFGIAHAAEAGVITQAGHAVGSPGFMSPEQAQGAETGPASDVFSLGAVLAFAATGEGPFGNASMHVLLYRVVHEPARLDHIADAGLRDLVAACLEKGPERRPAPGELLQWLAPRAPRTATLQGTDWLPGPIAADVARHTDQAVPARTVASPVPPGPAAPPGFPPGAAPGFTSGSTPGSAPGGLDRRRLLVLGGAGAAVLAVGGGVAVAMAGSGDGSRNGSGAGASASPAARPTATSASAPPPTLVGRVRWKHDTGGYLVSDPTVSDGVVYIGAEKADLLALDATTGKPRWRHRIARPNEDVSAAPAVAGGVVYAGSPDGDLHALDARTGRQRWRYGAGTQVASAPVVVGGTVYVASQQGNIFRGLKGGYLTALSAATGAVKWRSRTKAAINSGFVVAGGVIYLPDDSLVALDAGTGRVKWTYKNKGIHSPVLAGGVVYCGNFLGEELHAVDAATGRRRWSYRTGSSITARPLVMGGKVFVGDSDGNMYALDAATGSLRWQLQTNGRIESNAALAGGLVCFASGAFSKGRVYAVDPAGGHAVWRYETDEGIESSPAVAPDGTVYVSCKNGSIYALDIKGGTETAPPLTN